MLHALTLRRALLGAALTGAGLGAAPALANAASTCTLDETTHRATVVDGSGTAPLRIVRSGSFVAAEDGSGALVFCGGPTSFATVTNTDRVSVVGTSLGGSDGYIVDASQGVLGPGRTPETDGNSELEVVINELGNARSQLTYIGTDGPDTVRPVASTQMAIGDDNDTDIFIGHSDFSAGAYRASRLVVDGRGSADFISGRGVFVGFPATVPVALFGGKGNDTLVDGTASGDTLSGDEGSDTLFSVDGHFDFLRGGSEFDTATIDKLEDPGTAGEIESITLGTVGKARMAPQVVAAKADGSATLDVSWTHPKSWRDLRSVMVRLLRGTKKLAMINVSPRDGRLSADGAVELARGSRVTRHGKTVHAKVALRVDRSLAGQTLRVDVAATDRDGRTQTEPDIGALRVTR